MKVLITGGAGFIGCNLAMYLASKGHSITIYDNLSRIGTKNNLNWLIDNIDNKLIDIVVDDVRNYQVLLKYTEDVELICHLAAQTAVTGSLVDPKNDFEVNALGSFNVLEAARHSNANPVLIYASTNKVYGTSPNFSISKQSNRYVYSNNHHGINERQNLDFHSPYGCSKGAADQYIIDYARIYGLKTVTLRQSCIYGIRQMGNEDQGWIAHFIISALQGNEITIYGDGCQVRDALYITDLLTLYDLITQRIDSIRGQVYNIGGGPDNTISLLEFIIKLEDILNQKINFSFSDWRTGDQKVYISDIRRVKTDLDWHPTIGIDNGIRKLVSWIKDNLHLIR